MTEKKVFRGTFSLLLCLLLLCCPVSGQAAQNPETAAPATVFTFEIEEEAADADSSVPQTGEADCLPILGCFQLFAMIGIVLFKLRKGKVV